MEVRRIFVTGTTARPQWESAICAFVMFAFVLCRTGFLKDHLLMDEYVAICRKLADYSLGRADIVRRAMSKKKYDVLEKMHEE